MRFLVFLILWRGMFVGGEDGRKGTCEGILRVLHK